MIYSHRHVLSLKAPRRRTFDGDGRSPYPVTTMPSTNAKEISARSPLSGHPVWLQPLLALNLLGLLLLLAR